MTTPRILDAAGAAALDRRTIDRGVPSRALMQRAGAAAAGEIARRFGDRLGGGVAVLTGPGNNGGDGWVVARALHAAGVRCVVREVAPARTDDAVAERALARDAGVPCAAGALDAVPGAGPWGVVVDAMLGIGASGAPRGPIADAAARVAALRAAGALVVALDVPTGVHDLGAADGAVVADLTLTFGAVKRGLLAARAHAGTIVVLDVGFGEPADAASLPALLSDGWVRTHVPPIAPDAHKGTRRKLAILGGAPGMAGAAVLAGRAAIASGIGMVRLVVPAASLPAVQAAMPEALATAWPADRDAFGDAVAGWADALVVGPGLGRDAGARALLDHALDAWRGPLLLDADALTLFAGRIDELAARLAGRAALLTPHPVEFARLAGLDVADVLARRFDVGAELAARTQAAVLLKGTPTVVSAPDGRRLVSATGSATLAAAGSGDLLAGVAGTLLAQVGDAADAGACAAYVHGLAANLADGFGARGARGTTLADVLAALPDAWRPRSSRDAYPVLLSIPAP